MPHVLPEVSWLEGGRRVRGSRLQFCHRNRTACTTQIPLNSVSPRRDAGWGKSYRLLGSPHKTSTVVGNTGLACSCYAHAPTKHQYPQVLNIYKRHVAVKIALNIYYYHD